MKWFAQAPSNIALIKYMGKADSETNVPANPSLSYTLNELKTNVELESTRITKDIWEPLELPGLTDALDLSKDGQQRYIDHLNFLKEHFNYKGYFVIRSCNNFPHSAGIASSASSFAALTKCAVRALCELNKKEEPSDEEQAILSRHGSGSSCRSFFSPWALWEKDHAKAIELPYQHLLHQVVIVNRNIKSVSSSEAHLRITTSSLYEERPRRATENLKLLLTALNNKDWSASYEIVWREFQDLHQLFESAAQPFSYLTDESRSILRVIQKYWEVNGDGPLVTMDAGPNVHLLYRPEQMDLARQIKQDYFVGNYDVL